MQYLVLQLEAVLMDYLHPSCGEYTFWCVAGMEILMIFTLFIAALLFVGSLLHD